MEYQEFAKYYDIFYQKKDYQKEVDFLMNFISTEDNVIDIGCGTGIHASLIKKKNVNIEGLDLNKEMLDIAKTRLKSNLYLQNILNINIDKKYDVIISMFAVINHLKNIKELEKCFLNLKSILKNNGLIIIDLHNPQKSGKKMDSYNNLTRIMEWDYNPQSKIEKSKITFIKDNKKYNDSHTFRIFTIDEIEKVAEKTNLKLEKIYENYDINKIGTANSKNIQFIIRNL